MLVFIDEVQSAGGQRVARSSFYCCQVMLLMPSPGGKLQSNERLLPDMSGPVIKGAIFAGLGRSQ